MSDVVTELRCDLLSLPYELLLRMATWLDMHDVAYSLPFVCAALYAVAHDPAVWSRVVVRACNAKELQWILHKFPSITIVASPAVTAAAQTRDLRLAALSLGVRFSADIHAVAPSLEHVVCYGFHELLEQCTSLLSLTLRSNAACITSAAASNLSRLTRLVAPGLFKVDPGAFPALVSLQSDSDGLDCDTWNTFVEGHSCLRTLGLMELGATEVAFESVPTTLTSLTVGKERMEAPPLAEANYCKLLRGNASLKVFGCYSRVGAAVVAALAQRTSLTEISELRLVPNISVSIMKEFASNLKLEVLRVLGANLLCSAESEYHMAPALWQPRLLLGPYQTSSSKIIAFGARLVNLQELSLSEIGINKYLTACIGENCKHLKVLSLVNVDTDESVSLMSPALESLRSLTIQRAECAHIVAKAAGRSPFLRSVSMTGRPWHVHDFVAELLSEKRFGVLEWLALDSVNATTLRLLREHADCGNLRVRRYNGSLACKDDAADGEMRATNEVLKVAFGCCAGASESRLWECRSASISVNSTTDCSADSSTPRGSDDYGLAESPSVATSDPGWTWAVTDEKSTTVLGLTNDCLVHIAFFLDTHTVVNTLPRVCKILRQVAYDPVLWARALVQPCCSAELLWLADRFPTMTRIEFACDDQAVMEAVAARCPGIIKWPGLTAHYPENQLNLECVRLGRGQTSVATSCQLSLRKLTVSHSLEPEAWSTLVGSCSNVQSLVCCGFIEVIPDGLPNLMRISDRESQLDVTNWRTFVETHTRLEHLRLGEFYGSGDPSLVPVGLRSLVFGTSNEDAYPLGYAIVSASAASLASLMWGDAATEEFFTAAASCTSLLELVLPGGPTPNIPIEAISNFANAVSLRRLDVHNTSTITEEYAVALVPALYRALELFGWAVARALALPALVPHMRNLTSLSFDFTCTIEACILLGQHVKHLRKLTVWDNANHTEAHYNALIPAVGTLHSLRVQHCRPELVGLAAACCASLKLEDLFLFRVCDGEVVLSQCLAAVAGRTLHSLLLADLTDSAMAAVATAASTGALSAYFPSVSRDTFAFEEWEVAELRCVERGIRPCGRGSM